MVSFNHFNNLAMKIVSGRDKVILIHILFNYLFKSLYPYVWMNAILP